MSGRSRGMRIAGLLLALALVGGPPSAIAVDPSADDPAASVNGMLDALIAKDFAGMIPFVCAELREATAERYDLEAQLQGLPESVDVEALLAGMTIEGQDRSVSVVADDGTTATVAVAVTLAVTVDPSAARTFVRQLLEAEGEDASDAAVDGVLPLFTAQLEQTQEITQELRVVREDGVWLVCDELGAGGSAPTPTPAGPAASPDPAAHERLLGLVPEPVRASCVAASASGDAGTGPLAAEIADVGRSAIASVSCGPGPDGGHLRLALFADLDSTRAAYDRLFLRVLELTMDPDGLLVPPTCAAGAGEGRWDAGEFVCYLGGERGVAWTHEDLHLVGHAAVDVPAGTPDDEWTALRTLLDGAGQLAP